MSGGASRLAHNANRRGLKVGVTMFLRDETQSLWENGIFQNCHFLLMLLARAPSIENCFIVNGGPGDPSKMKEFLAQSPVAVLSMAEAMNELDIVIELSAQLDAEWGRQFSSRGGRIIGMHVANDYIIDVERMIYDLPHGSLMAKVPYDEIWTLPAFAQTCASYYQFGFGAPVRVMQHLWNPSLLEKAVISSESQPFIYQPGRLRWRLAVLEPNICTVKTCQLPMLLCDVAYRRQPKSIERMLVFNALTLKENSHFVAYARSLDLVKHGNATFEGRFPIYQTMTELADAIVSHHWHNAQNYLYYEALYGGYPLIHNSHLLGGCGYAYRDFDPEDGALALLEAFAEHDRNLSSYRADATAFLATLDPCRPENVALYEQALLRLTQIEKLA